jgi:hypothetical protein
MSDANLFGGQTDAEGNLINFGGVGGSDVYETGIGNGSEDTGNKTNIFGSTNETANADNSGNTKALTTADTSGFPPLSNLADIKKWVENNKGLLGLAGAAAGLMTNTSGLYGKTGYQGSIPSLLASRNMITAPPVGRRAGAGGVNYGGDVTYTRAPAGTDPWTNLHGDSAFVTDPQSQANVLKGTGGTDAQSMANKISYNLPGGWGGFTPDQKISWFNQNNISIDQLRAAGVPQSDIDYMWSNGYTSGRPADWGKTKTTTGGADTVTSGVGADTITAGNGIDTLTKAQTTAQTQADKIGLKLPSDWSTYDAAKKIAWYNSNNITPEQLTTAGVDQATIDWMKQNGYGKTAGETLNNFLKAGLNLTQDETGLTNNLTKNGGIGTLDNAQKTAQTQADNIGLKLPSDWASYDPAKKIAWFNQQGTTAKQLLDAGVSQGDIDYMQQRGLATASTRPDIGNTQSAGLMSALNQGMSQDKYISNIKDFLNQNNTASDADIYKQMQKYGIGAEDVASALGVPVSTIQGKIQALQIPSDYNPPEVESRSSGLQSALDQGMDKGQYIGNIKGWLTKNSSASDAEVFKQMQEYGIGAEDVAAALGVPVSTIENKIKALQQPAQSAGMKSAIDQGMSQDQYIGNIKNWLNSNANATDAEVYDQMKQYGIGAEDVANALGVPVSVIKGKLKDLGVEGYAQGGTARYLRGQTDGMADEIPSSIGGKEPAALSHGEFVIPADVVSHLGNGNSDAGAKKLYQMMDKLRMARTGTKKQGKKINPDKFMPGGLAQAYAQGGKVKRFVDGGTTGTPAANVNAGIAGVESNLSNWAGDYTTNMLGQGQALANMPFQQYMGPLTAGPSALQNKVSEGLGSLNFPGNLGQSFSSAGTPTAGANGLPSGGNGIASNYMNPYLQNVLQPQLAELRRQNDITNMNTNAKLTGAGGYGGGRQAIMNAENDRNLLTAQNTAIGQGYANAFDKAQQQFNTEQGQAKTLADMMAGQGATDRSIESEGVAADKAQFEEARANPYKMVQFQQSLLQGLPLNAQSYSGIQQSDLVKAAQGATTVAGLLKNLGINIG